MKLALLLILSIASTSVFARQYIQCSVTDYDSTDVMVVNLQSEEGGTLFLSSGMQNPEDERVLVKIALDKMTNKNHIYKIIEEQGLGEVSIPSEVINKKSDFFEVNLHFAGFKFTYACFSRIYND